MPEFVPTAQIRADFIFRLRQTCFISLDRFVLARGV